MNLDIKKLTGKIIGSNEELIGSGFLIKEDLFFTVRHNIHDGIEEATEKEVKIIINNKEVKGKTINLKETYEKRLDFVIIKLDEKIFDLEFSKVIKSVHCLEKFQFKTYGYPKEKDNGFELSGKIISDKKNEYKDFLLEVSKENILGSYKGLSGSPIIVDDFIVGIIIEQGTEDKLSGISFKLIEEILFSTTTRSEIFDIQEKELNNTVLLNIKDINGKLSSSFFEKHIEEAFRIAGPRYSKKLNIKNETYKKLLSFLDEKFLLEDLKKYFKLLEKYPNRLKDCLVENSYTKASVFSENSKLEVYLFLDKINKLLLELKEIFDFKLDSFEKLENLVKEVKRSYSNLDYIFKDELKIFEEKHGKNKYDNKSWKGIMASYQCEFPTANLDTIKELENDLISFIYFIENNPIVFCFSKTLLVKGIGGMGKTHTLCDIVDYNISNNIPSLIFFGNYFKNKSPEEIILERLNLKELNFEDFLYKLNIIGERKNKIILICIDALNETENKNYWNDYLIPFTEKIKKYGFVKLIFSCRNIYLSEILQEEIANNLFPLEHKGFESIEQEALAEFFKYYEINIPFENKMQKEFSVPLFLKMYCEIIKESSEIEKINFDIGSLTDLLNKFIELKNEKTSKKYSEWISPRDGLIEACTLTIIKKMLSTNKNYIEWKELKGIICNVFKEKNIEGLSTKLILDDLLSENILKENGTKEESISFSFEKIYDFLIAKETMKNNKEKLKEEIKKFTNKIEIYKGSLEILNILYKEKYNKELINEFGLSDNLYYDLFLNSLSWRKSINIDNEAKEILEYCLMKSRVPELTEKAFFVILEFSVRKDCIINANYFHELFKGKNLIDRDRFLGYVMLKAYEKKEIVNKILNNALYLKENKLEKDIIELWELMLGWFTSLNDIYTRDLASKALTKLIKLYPDTIFYIIDKFRNIEDDYIHERIWGAIYSSLILNENEKHINEVIDFVYDNYIKNAKLTSNVLIRDFIRNIAEFADYKGLLKYKIEDFRPSYESKKIKKINMKYDNLSELYKRLFFNCTQDDFGIYTIPSEVENYGFTKEEVGKIIFNEIRLMGYNDDIKNLDNYIDSTYGSLRSRDESIERIGKKYQKIFLYRVLGQIYDNFEYKPKDSYSDEVEIIPKEQGNKFREIDLTALPYHKLKNNFLGSNLNYDFRKTENLTYEEWFSKEDVQENVKEIITTIFNNEEYILLDGHFDCEKIENNLDEYPKKVLWNNINSYLITRDNLDTLKEWVKDKHFWGKWMPEGVTSLYEGWIAEYPWSPTYRNILEEIVEEEEAIEENVEEDLTHAVYLRLAIDEAENEVSGSNSNDIVTLAMEKLKNKEKLKKTFLLKQEKEYSKTNPPVNIIPTVNKFNNEKDSQFCSSDIEDKFSFPCTTFFKDLDLKWNGENAFYLNEDIMFLIGSGNNTSIYVNKKLLDKYLNDKKYTLVWTVLGEKQVINGGFNSEFVGSAEFSESYIYEENKVKENHYLYKINNPIKRD